MKKEMDHLTEDVLRAERLGYKSYGRYKVDHPRTKEHYDEPEAPQGQICPGCRERFYPQRKGMIYCCKRCRERHRYHTHKKPKEE